MYLVCVIEPFDHLQAVYLANSAGIMKKLADIDIVSLYSFVLSYCHDHGIKKIKLLGIRDYNQMVKDEIREFEKALHQDYDPIEIEIGVDNDVF